MKLIRNATESEMILEFLRGELNSNRFNSDLNKVLKKLNIESNIITNGNILDSKENKLRLQIMKEYRGYPDKELFYLFPKEIDWKYVKLSSEDLDNIFYIDYDYWNLLSSNTSKPSEAVKTIKNDIEIFDVSNQPFLDGVEYLKNNSFPPVVLLTCNGEKFLIIEGHSRMTIYAFLPSKLNNTYAYIGYCSEEEMKKYDIRMLKGESLKSRK